MKIFHSLTQLPPDFGPVIATIGNFDGVHRGHRWVIDQVNARARSLGLKSLCITFAPHPVRVLRPDAPHSLITPHTQKLDLLATTGIDATLVIPFTEALSRLSAAAFAKEILCDACRVREVHEGEAFRFGHNAAADMHSLEALGRDLNFGVRAYSPHILRGGPISSSRIRQLIAAGEVSHARALLGRPFAIRSTPASGRGYGTRYTVPTINLAPYTELLPAHGVYITTLTIGKSQGAPFIAPLSHAMSGNSTSGEECFEAVTNIGNRPTFGADSFTVESHILNFHPIALAEDTPLELAFLYRLRDEQRFPSPEALLTQIKKDVAKAQRFFALNEALQKVAAPKTVHGSAGSVRA
jgi:riboflavin kinase/FMN adenylyltransferase